MAVEQWELPVNRHIQSSLSGDFQKFTGLSFLGCSPRKLRVETERN